MGQRKISQSINAARSIPIGQSNGQPSAVYTVPELAESLKISKTCAWMLIWNRKIGFHRIGRRVVVSAAQLEAYLESTRVAPFDGKAAAQKLIKGK